MLRKLLHSFNDYKNARLAEKKSSGKKVVSGKVTFLVLRNKGEEKIKHFFTAVKLTKKF